MPTYDYRCSHCGRTAEVFQKSREDEPHACGNAVQGVPFCPGTMHRTISAPAVPPSGTYSYSR